MKQGAAECVGFSVETAIWGSAISRMILIGY